MESQLDRVVTLQPPLLVVLSVAIESPLESPAFPALEPAEAKERALDAAAAQFIALAERSGEPLRFVPIYRRAARALLEKHSSRLISRDSVAAGEVEEYRIVVEGQSPQ